MGREATRCIPGRNIEQNAKVKGKGQVQGHGGLSPASEPGGLCPTPAPQLGQLGLAALGADTAKTPWGCPAWPGPASPTESSDSTSIKPPHTGSSSRQDPELGKAAAQGCQSRGCACSSITSPQGASVRGLAEEQGPSRFAWVGIRGGKTSFSSSELCLRDLGSRKRL